MSVRVDNIQNTTRKQKIYIQKYKKFRDIFQLFNIQIAHKTYNPFKKKLFKTNNPNLKR